MPSEPEEYNTSRLPSLPVSNKGLTSSSFQIFAGIFETVELVLMTASTRLPIFGSSHLQTLTVTWSPFLKANFLPRLRVTDFFSPSGCPMFPRSGLPNSGG